MNHAAMFVAASSGPPPIVTSSAQALIPAMVGALAFIVAAAVTILAVFMQSEKSNRYARALCALGIVYLLVASFCSLRDAIFALTTRPPGTLPALRGVAWTILFPALCGLVVIGVVACIMMAQFVCDWTPERADRFKIGYRTFPIFTIALAPVIAIGIILSPYRIILLPGWLVKGVVVVAIILMTGFVVLIKTHGPSGDQPVAARATGVVGEQSGQSRAAP
jgi:hypothetical protein